MPDEHDFLSALFGSKPEGSGILLWRKDTKKTHPFGAITPAADWLSAVQDTDVYVAAGLTARVGKTRAQRGTASEVAAIPGVWADIDINGGPEGKTGAAPTVQDALALANALLQPTLIVNSGYGIQAWWLLQGGPWIFRSAEDRAAAAKMVQGFQAALRTTAKSDGWTIDSTFDLARLMRVPGTRNHKGSSPRPVTIMNKSGGLYTLEAIEDIAAEYAAVIAEKQQPTQGAHVELRGTEAIPSWRVGQLVGGDVEFKTVWDRKKLGRYQSWSDSQFDLSIASRLADAGASDQEIADALVHNRLLHGDPKGKSGRQDYISMTIARARIRADLEDAREHEESQRAHAEDQLQVMASNGETVDPERTVSLFTKVLGGPEIKELIQDSRDPEQARFRLVLADGTEVPIGPAFNLMTADKFRVAFAVTTGYVVPDVKREKWHKIVQALLQAATVNEAADDTREARVIAWVADYADRGLSNDKNAACQAHDPFKYEGLLYVPLGPFVHWLRRMRGERYNEADVKQLLIAASFERVTVNYYKDNSKKSSRSYWMADEDVLDFTDADSALPERQEPAQEGLGVAGEGSEPS